MRLANRSDAGRRHGRLRRAPKQAIHSVDEADLAVNDFREMASDHLRVEDVGLPFNSQSVAKEVVRQNVAEALHEVPGVSRRERLLRVEALAIGCDCQHPDRLRPSLSPNRFRGFRDKSPGVRRWYG